MASDDGYRVGLRKRTNTLVSKALAPLTLTKRLAANQFDHRIRNESPNKICTSCDPRLNNRILPSPLHHFTCFDPPAHYFWVKYNIH